MKHTAAKRIGIGIACAALSASCLGLTFSAARKNGQGGDFYQKGDYENALKKYSEAMTEAPEKPQLYFNIGDVFYRQAKFPEAVKLYEKSAAPGDPGLQAKSWYNMGNAKYRAAGKGGDPNAPKETAEEGGDPNALREAAACYIKSLESDPDDMDAKYNLEFVQRALKQQQQQQKEQEKKDQKDQKQDQQDKQDQEQDQKEQEKKEQEKKDQEQKEQQKDQQKDQQKELEKKDQENKDQEKKDQEKKDQEQKKPEQAKQEEKPTGETAQAEKGEQPDKDLSEQQARQLIESLEREERDPTHFMKAEGSPQPTDIDKDW